MIDSAREARIHAIAAAVDGLRAEMIQALQELVQAPSQTGNEAPAQAVMARWMRELDLEVDVWEPDAASLAPYAESLTLGNGFQGRPNVVGVQRGAGHGRSLILNGHIDTVEVGDETAWGLEPLGGRVAGGQLYGRGACDMKGGLVANLFAFRALQVAGMAPAGDVIIESTISEEDGGAGALAAILRGYVADAALIAEPTNLAIVAAQGGSLMFRLRVPGLAAHACVRDEGVSAIENFAYLHRGLLDFEARHNQEIEHPLYQGMANKAPINIGTIQGGAWPSSVPEWLTAEGRAGLVPGETLAEFKVRLTDEINRLASEDVWLRHHAPQIEWLPGQFAPAGIDADSVLVTTLGAAWESVAGEPARIEGVTYGADMRHFINTVGMPCAMFGAGDVRLAHAPDEAIPLDDLCKATTALAVFVSDWSGVA